MQGTAAMIKQRHQVSRSKKMGKLQLDCNARTAQLLLSSRLSTTIENHLKGATSTEADLVKVVVSAACEAVELHQVPTSRARMISCQVKDAQSWFEACAR
jgi:hypothetical protein